MLKVIDLDTAPKDCDGYVFTLTLNGEKTGFSEQEIVDVLRAKVNAAAKPSARKAPARGKAAASAVDQGEDSNESELDSLRISAGNSDSEEFPANV